MNIVHNCDCMEFMKNIPDKYYELAIVDPPYGIGDFTSDVGVYKNRKEKSVKKYGKVNWNNSIPDNKYFKEIYRISKNQIIWGANYFNCFSQRGGSVIWYKGKINPVFSQCEIASLSFQKRVDYVHIDWQSGFARNKEGETIHPCQKPVELYLWLLKNYIKPGDKIFDSHVGSGSSRCACYELGFDFEGCELDVDYWKAQEERFKIFKAKVDNVYYIPDSENDLFRGQK
jgi:site-specific DNA-methyltransferase (adenine-specific)